MTAGAPNANDGYAGRSAGPSPLRAALSEGGMDDPEPDRASDGADDDGLGDSDDRDPCDEGDDRDPCSADDAADRAPGAQTVAGLAARTTADGADPAALAALLQRVGAGDEAAFGELYDATVGRVYGLALRVLREPRAAEEVAEDAFFQVWREARRFDPARGRPLAWILTIARSRALDHLRRRDPAGCHPDPDSLLETEPAVGGPQDLLAATRECGRLHDALAALDPVPRQMIALAFFRGFTHEEIALHAALPVGTVKSHIRRALLALRGILAPSTERSSLP